MTFPLFYYLNPENYLRTKKKRYVVVEQVDPAGLTRPFRILEMTYKKINDRTFSTLASAKDYMEELPK